MTSTGLYIVSAIVSGPMFFTNMLPIELEPRTPRVAFEQLSYCTTIDENVVGQCAGLYRNPLMMSDGRLLLPMKFPASRNLFIRDRAASRVVAYQ